MGIPDRVILTLYTFIMAVFALLIILCTFGLIPAGEIMEIITALPGSWEYAVAGVIIFGISIRLLLAGIGVFGVDTLTLVDSDNGKTTVSKRALENYIGDIAQEVYGIYGVKVAVTMEAKDAINARINASLEPGVNVFETTEEVKDNVRETIKKVVGLEVRNIEIFFKHIKSTSGNKG